MLAMGYCCRSRVVSFEAAMMGLVSLQRFAGGCLLSPARVEIDAVSMYVVQSKHYRRNVQSKLMCVCMYAASMA